MIPKVANFEKFLQTRKSLLGRLKKWDDGESWNDFFSIYGRFIYSVAIRSGLSDTEAQEVVQETIIAVSKHMPGFDYDPAKGSFKAWLCRLTHWRIKDQLRIRQRDAEHHADPPGDRSHPNSLENIPDPAFVAPAAWDEEWDRNLLDAAIQRVKERVRPKQFQMFDLYVLREWPIAKVTRTLAVNMGQVYLAKHRVRARIQAELKALQADTQKLRHGAPEVQKSNPKTQGKPKGKT